MNKLKVTGMSCAHCESAVTKALASVPGVERVLEVSRKKELAVDALKQIKAVQGALDKVGTLVLRSHLKDHVVTAATRGDTDQIEAELMEVLKYR
jgi:DNA-binding FrmR family transcriptional regulator